MFIEERAYCRPDQEYKSFNQLLVDAFVAGKEGNGVEFDNIVKEQHKLLEDTMQSSFDAGHKYPR